MSRERLVVVGGVAAGLSAASRARRVNAQLEIRVYEKGPDISYSACGLPHLVSGMVKGADALRVYSPDFFKKERGIDVLTGHEVVEIQAGRRVVTVARGGGLEEVPYDHLVLATGAELAIPEISGLDLAGVFHVNDLQSTLALIRYLDAERPRAAAVIGGGYIGLEMADALTARGMEVTLLSRSPRLFEAVDEEISKLAEAELEGHGVRTRCRTAVQALLGGAKRRLQRVIWDGGALEADCAVLATGVGPRVKLARDANIQLGAGSAIAVNAFMETSLAGVLAAGDCAEALHLVSGRNVYFPLGTTANKQGRIAGANAAGRRLRFAGIVGTAATKVFELELARTGLSLEEARAAGFNACAASIRAPAKARYLGGSDMAVRLVADRATGKLLGAQMAGRDGVAKRIDVCAAALHARMTVEQVADLDLSYAPPFSTVWDPILIAGQQMLRELKR